MGQHRTLVPLVAVAVALTATACGGGGGGEAADTSPAGSPAATSPAPASAPADPAVDPNVDPAAAASTTVAVATDPPVAVAAPPPVDQLRTAPVSVLSYVDLPKLTAMTTRPADGAEYFTSQTGEVWRFIYGTEPELVLDLTAEVSPWEQGSERGLLGIAFSPVDGRMFVYFTGVDLTSHVVSFAMDEAGHPDPASRWEVLTQEQPGLGHKGGGMAFTPDGTLFLALGDGGGSNGRDAQDYTKILGGIIRIIPSTTGPGYDVPPDNPFVGQPDRRPEIWAKGLRNPWGFCRDAATGDLWFGDVGNNTMEEVDRMRAGESGLNFGWYFIEGTQVNHEGAPADAVAPLWAYRHDEVGPAVIGGCVYRGVQSPALQGAYVFADMAGQLFAMGANDEVVPLPTTASGVVTGFGTTADGELIVLTLQKGAFHLAPTPAA